MADFKSGVRVYVLDEGLAQLRALMRQATGIDPKPNHHGPIAEVWDDDVLIHFDDGSGAPYPPALVRHLKEASNGE
ncbi:hypothetical protein [Phytoactinopolyspora mesophila]|uniref:DUF1918 domain-containing protein n=1 Tax=Phytoactinopolyspora mesophila TaxID=2650750 RepID=A0A7K3MA42_9ACTN|nr:hypothetical protein [Phytoactinopolyspora mesophila]NDL60201.1 hypothetical protein [Phytoactinopolyspora mesophila]